MAKIEAQRERHKRWLRKNPAFTIRQLEKWVIRAKDNPDELSRAKRILASHKKRFEKEKENEKKISTREHRQNILFS